MLISLVDTTCLANMTDKTALTGDSAAIPFHSSSLTKGVLVSRSSRLIADKRCDTLARFPSFGHLSFLGVVVAIEW